MRLLVLIGIFAAEALLVSCSPSSSDYEVKVLSTTVCKQFTFRVIGKAAVTEARKDFYELAIHHGSQFKDDAIAQVASFTPGSGRFSLAYGDYLNDTNEQALRKLKVYWFDDEKIYLGVHSFPCGFPGEEKAFEKIKSIYSRNGQMVEAVDTPQIQKPSVDRK